MHQMVRCGAGPAREHPAERGAALPIDPLPELAIQTATGLERRIDSRRGEIRVAQGFSACYVKGERR
jgi:hypothetical protein